MISEPEKFEIKDLSNKTICQFIAEPKKIETNDEFGNPISDYILERIKIKVGQEEAVISIGDLRSILFALSNPIEQKKMIPIQMVTQRRYNTVIGVKADKNIKKGEMVNFKVDIPLPPIEKEIMLEATRQIKHGLIKPV